MATDDELRRLARAATPGPWGVTHYAGGLDFAGPPVLYAGTDPEYGEPRRLPQTEADAAFMAAVSPAVVLALLDRLARWEPRARIDSADSNWPSPGYLTPPPDSSPVGE